MMMNDMTCATKLNNVNTLSSKIVLTLLHIMMMRMEYTSVQRDSWSWSRNSRLGLSRPRIGLGLDRIFKSRPVLVLVSFEISFQDKSWSWSRLKFSFKTSLGIGLERQKNQDKINTKQGNNEESKNGLYHLVGWC